MQYEVTGKTTLIASGLTVVALLMIPLPTVMRDGLAQGVGYHALPAGADVLSDAVAALTGEFGVDESGAATYSIPLYTVPGTAGVVPQLSLMYSSQGGNGPLGKGWSIGGLSVITRCLATREAGDSSLTACQPMAHRVRLISA